MLFCLGFGAAPLKMSPFSQSSHKLHATRGQECPRHTNVPSSFSSGPSHPFCGLLKGRLQLPVCGSSLCRPCRLYLSEAYRFSYAASRLPLSCPHLFRTCVHWISSSQPFCSSPHFVCCQKQRA